MQVVVIRDVKACTQMELFSPENCLVLEMKLTVLNMCPTHPLKESIKLVYCGKVLSDYDTLSDTLRDVCKVIVVSRHFLLCVVLYHLIVCFFMLCIIYREKMDPVYLLFMQSLMKLLVSYKAALMLYTI